VLRADTFQNQANRAREGKVCVRSRESLQVVAFVHPSSLPVAGWKAHDINAGKSARLHPLKYGFCSSDADSVADRDI
jgi:hypothetical protein